MQSETRKIPSFFVPLCFTPPTPVSVAARCLPSTSPLRTSTPLSASPCTPVRRRARYSPGPTVVTMSTSSAQLLRRIAAVQSAEKIVSALRLVAAARIRSSSNAALRSRPFAEELQTVLAQLVEHVCNREIDIIGAAQSAPPFTISGLHGPLLADPVVQKALLDRMYLAVFSPTVFPTSASNSDSSSKPTNTLARSMCTILTVVTADRKFCGSYNKDVLTRATQRISQLRLVGVRVELVLVGRIAKTHFDRNMPHIPVRAFLTGLSSLSAERTAADLSQTLLAEFIAGDVARVEIIYTRFVSLITTVPSVRTLLPLTPSGLESLGDEMFQLTVTSRNGRIIPVKASSSSSSKSASDHYYHQHEHHPNDELDPASAHSHHYSTNSSSSSSAAEKSDFFKRTLYSISDQDAILLLNSMVPMYFTSQLIRIMREALASEQVSRLAAMTAATDNARELITTLRAQYNKERQARITKEIIEVIGNASTTTY